MLTNLLQVFSFLCSGAPLTLALLRPKRKEPGRVINDHRTATCSPSVNRTWNHRSGHSRSCQMMIFEISYSGMVSDKYQNYVPVACQREIKEENLFHLVS